MLTVAVASDLHACAAGSQESFLVEGLSRTPWKQHPLESLRRLIEEQSLTADYLVCPGDFTNKCSLAGFKVGWDAVNEIAHYLGAEVIGTLGNHDVDSRDDHRAGDAFIHARAVDAKFPVGNAVANADYWGKGFAIINGAQASFLVINSVAEHTNPENARHGSVSDSMREQIEDAVGAHIHHSLRIAIVHHHPHLHEDLNLGADDVMHGGSKLMAALGRLGFQLIIHGHKHHPKLSYAAGDSSSIAVFAAGSLTRINYAMLASNTRNLFHLMQVATSTRLDCSVFGTIRSWEYNAGDRWNPSTMRSARFPHNSGFGCRLTAAQLVADVAASVSSRARWEEVVQAVPGLPYTLPTTRDAVLANLPSAAIRVMHDELGEPSDFARDGTAHV